MTTRQRTITPTAEDAASAAKASRALFDRDGTTRALRLGLENGPDVPLPEAVAELLRLVLTEIADGKTISLMPTDVGLSTQEAADRLNVSRPFLIHLLGQGNDRIPYRKVGTHRRIKLADLEAYRRKAEQRRQDIMQELADEAQDMGLGY